MHLKGVFILTILNFIRKKLPKIRNIFYIYMLLYFSKKIVNFFENYIKSVIEYS